MPDWDPADFENALIADMRAHDGAVTQGPLAGDPLLVLTMTGAKSGLPRRAILTYTRDSGDYIVAASKGGAPTDPVWLRNLRANPNVTVEAGNTTFQATARVVDDADDHDGLWAAHVARLPNFADYPTKAGRIIPVVRLTPQQSS
jgi:deazaflavin-dependent oxidoreductase (nitroreductase family)